MDKVVRTVLGLLVGAVAFYGVRELVRKPVDRQALSRAFDGQMVGLSERAAEKYPGLPKSDAIKRLASDESAERMSTQNSGQQANTAARMFFGFYWINMRSRADYCAGRGVDITAFTEAFDRVHHAELMRASSLYSRAGVDPESIAPSVLPELLVAVEQDMKDFAAGAQLPVGQACGLFNANAGQLATLIQMPPHVKGALMAEN